MIPSQHSMNPIKREVVTGDILKINKRFEEKIGIGYTHKMAEK